MKLILLDVAASFFVCLRVSFTVSGYRKTTMLCFFKKLAARVLLSNELFSRDIERKNDEKRSVIVVYHESESSFSFFFIIEISREQIKKKKKSLLN